MTKMAQSRVLLGPDLLDPTPKPYLAVIIVDPCRLTAIHRKGYAFPLNVCSLKTKEECHVALSGKAGRIFAFYPVWPPPKRLRLSAECQTPDGSHSSPSSGWLKYRLANKRGVAGPLDAWPGDCDTVTPVPVIVSPPGIDADGFAAGLRRDFPQRKSSSSTSPPNWGHTYIAA